MVEQGIRSTSLYEQLRALRKGDGLTPRRLGSAPAVLTAIEADTGTAGVVALKAKIASLPESRERDAMANALNLQGTGQSTTTARRSDFALDIDAHVKTVAAWEDDGFEILAHELQPQLATKADLLVEVWIRVSVLPDLTPWQIAITKTFQRPDGQTYDESRNITPRPDSPPRWRGIIYAIDPKDAPQPGQEPADLNFIITWSDERPPHYWWRVYDSVADFACRSFRVSKHMHPDDPLADNIGLQFEAVPGWLYEVCW